ncbi:MAG: CotH kinase family protein [Oscillospiraceae bacterium]|nr:CotH kinase family protein [Oscillospiraceae bacterium]
MKKSVAAGTLFLLILLLALALCHAALTAPSRTASEVEAESAPTEAPAPAVSGSALVISELMASNKASVPIDGGCPDWVELYNPGDQTETLDGCLLRCGKKSMALSGTLAPGGYALIPCVELTLPKEGAELCLLEGNGALVDSVSYGDAPADQSLVRTEDGALAVCRWPSPGQENTAAGYAAFQETLKGGELVLYEVMVCNDRFPGADGEYRDWVELKNVSGETLSLADYHLAEKRSEWGLGALPGFTLEPGESVVLYSETEDGFSFRLSAQEETLLLFRDDGSLCDAVCLHDLPLGASMGRMDGRGGFFYFAEPSPGAENAGGVRRTAARPVSAEPGGVFDGAESVSVTLSGEGEIRYTLDGSLPTEDSALYTGPLTFEETGVLRAVCFAPDALPSRSLDLSFILGEGHTLPVVSVIAAPDALFGKSAGIYANPQEDREIPASAVLFADERGFEPIECGLKIHGATSRLAQDKKSFKLCFRGRYGGELACDLFENGVTEFDSILLRAAQESSISTQIRDILMHVLAKECSPDLSVQDYRYCVLYLNGEYWGLYALREAHSAAHFARHFGYDPERVSMTQGGWPDDDASRALLREILDGNLRDEEVYARICERLDVESVIAWSIIESFSGNIDINPPNMRYYRSEEDGVLHYALVDLDLGLFTFGSADLSMHTGYVYSDVIRYLLNNESFRALYVQRLSEFLHGPLSDEHYLAEAHRLADEIRPETERDYLRWGERPVYWENEMETYIYSFVNWPGGHDVLFARSARSPLHISTEEWDSLFADLSR